MHFPFANYFINSHNFFSWLCVENVGRKLMLVTLETSTVKLLLLLWRLKLYNSSMLTWEKSESLMNSRGWWGTNTCRSIKRCVGIKDVWCDSKSVLEPWQKPKYIFNISFIHSCLCHWLRKKEKKNFSLIHNITIHNTANMSPIDISIIAVSRMFFTWT